MTNRVGVEGEAAAESFERPLSDGRSGDERGKRREEERLVPLPSSPQQHDDRPCTG